MTTPTIVRVSVKPGARREKVTKESETAFVVEVQEPAERGEANRRVREIIASHFSIPVGRVRLRTGQRSPKKSFEVSR